MNLDDANYFEPLAARLYGKKELKENTKLKRKFLYMEGIIRFLNLYCQNELGSGRVNIQKVCLWVNSPWFENHMLWSLRNIHDVYRYLERDILNNVPLYRLLDISDHLRGILERDHIEALQQEMMQEAEKYPCLKCIWYYIKMTSLGVISECERPSSSEFRLNRDRYLNIHRVHSCQYCTTIDTVPEKIKKMQLPSRSQRCDGDIEERISACRERWQKKYDALDNAVIPSSFETMDLAALKKQIEEKPFSDFARVCNYKQPYTDIYRNLQEAMILEAMIEFVEIYAKTEIGTSYIADIAKIAEYVYKKRSSNKLNFATKDDIYKWLEDMILAGEDITRFCKYFNE